MTDCLDCGKPLRGAGRYGGFGYVRPTYCAECGKLYPWTVAAIAAASEFATEVELSEMDRNELPDIIENLVQRHPPGVASQLRMRRILERLNRGPTKDSGPSWST